MSESLILAIQFPQGIQECEEEAARVGRDRGVPAYDSWRLFCRLCRRLNTNKNNKRSRISRRLLYAAIIDDALRWLRQRDKVVNSFVLVDIITMFYWTLLVINENEICIPLSIYRPNTA